MAMKKLKERWGIHSNWRLGIIFLVFAVTGSSAAKITGPVVKSIGWVKELPYWQYAVLYVVSTLIIYQFLLVFFGWLFGEYNFFWNFVKRILKRIGFKFLFKM